METKLHQNRTVVLGQTYRDAHHALSHPAFKDSLERPALLGAVADPLVLQGSVGGMSVGIIYVTPTAHRGKNYDVAREALDRTGGRYVLLHDDGSTTEGL